MFFEEINNELRSRQKEKRMLENEISNMNSMSLHKADKKERLENLVTDRKKVCTEVIQTVTKKHCCDAQCALSKIWKKFHRKQLTP